MSLEIDGKIGGVLVGLRAMEEQAGNQASALANELSKLEESRRESLSRATDLEALAQRIERVLPGIDVVEAVPGLLPLQAERAAEANEYAPATALLAQLLESSEAESSDLERGGDVAREQLQNRALARKLYARSVEIDRDNISAQAELLRLSATRSELRESAKEQILGLARTNPNHRNVIARLLDFLTEIDDYAGMALICRELLERGSVAKTTLLRNLGIALSHLDESPDAVLDAYRRGAEGASDVDFVNLARPYVGYLIRQQLWTESEPVLRKALLIAPREASLLLLAGMQSEGRGGDDLAAKYYAMAAQYGDPRERAEAERRSRDIIARGNLRIAGL